MGWSALINQWGEGYRAKKVSEAEDERQQAYFDFMNEQQDNLFELFQGPGIAQGLLEDIVGRGGEGEILNYLFAPPIKMTAGEKREYGLFQESEPMALDIVQQLLGLRGPIDELVRTGFKTDIAPIIAGERYRLNTETAPELAARFGGAISGSGFEQALAQAGEDLGMYLGEKEYDANEAAAARRVTGLNMAPDLYASPLNLQTGFAEALGAAGERYRLRKEATRRSNVGAKLLQALGMLGGLEQGQGFVMPGYPGGAQSGLGAASWGAGVPGLLAGAGSLASGLGSLLNMFGGGGTTTGGGYPYDQGGIGGTGIDSSGFDMLFSNPTSTSQTTLGGGYAYV